MPSSSPSSSPRRSPRKATATKTAASESKRTGLFNENDVDSSTKVTSSQKQVAQTGKTWGRARDVGFLSIFISFCIMAFCPFLVIYFWLACDSYQCSLSEPFFDLLNHGLNAEGVLAWAIKVFPRPTTEGIYLFAIWLVFQGLLYQYLPGPIGYGQRTPAGHLLPYVVNGLNAWVVSHALFIGLSIGLGWFSPAIVHDNWGAILVAANVYGYFLSVFSYIKAHVAPSHADDRKFSGSVIYDLFWGIEFNPRFGKWFDFKLFHNGRPGIVAWTLINFSFAAAQYYLYDGVTNSMIIVNWLHLVYVLDFFFCEDWYLRTIDIAHDHFGFYLAWGDSVWLPFMYTLQSHYLVRNPVHLSRPYALLVLAIGTLGYYVFRETNNQKDIVRTNQGKCNIWGKPATFIRTKYITSDGKEHSSLLLTSGFWGWSRHFNYVGDLMMSLAMCMACGFGHVLPYFYIVYMTILLVARIGRDNHRCKGKYGKYWDEYCKQVPYKLIPYVW